MKGFKEWKKAQKFDPEAPFTVNEFEELARGIEFGVKVRKILTGQPGRLAGYLIFE